MRWIGSALLLALASGCPAPTATICDNGDICPATSACIPNAGCRIATDGGGGDDVDADMSCAVADYTCVDARWRAMDSHVTSRFNDVWVADEQNVFALAEDGSVFRYDGSDWAPHSKVTLVSGHVARGLWGRSTTEMYIAADDDFVYRWSGAGWTNVADATRALYAITGTATFIIAVGFGGAYVTNTNNVWSGGMSRNGAAFNGVAVASNGDWYGVGGSGRVDRVGNGSEGIMAPVNNLAGAAATGTTVYAVGDASNGEAGIYKVGTGPLSLAQESSTGADPQPLQGIWVNGTLGFAVGGSGQIYAFDGTTWTRESTAAAGTKGTKDLTAVDASVSSAFAVGVDGVILRRSITP